MTVGAPHSEPPSESFVESALALGGKSADEIQATGRVDRADQQVESLFARAYQTAGSPIHRAIWEDPFPTEMFAAPQAPADQRAEGVMNASLELVRSLRREQRLYDGAGKISDVALRELAAAGYWGLLVDKPYGGSGASFQSFARFLTRMATVDATVAGLASVHGCIGAVDPLRTFGNAQQKQRLLPLLASGKRLSAFALTEPGAGSDLTALRTTAVPRDDHYLVTGEKLFITNAIPGRMIGLVCLIEGKPAVLIAELPEHETEHFRLVNYGLYALKRSYNNGLLFTNFPVPRQNLLQPEKGDGLAIAYHGLNRGRVALCATAAGTMRLMLASMIPWANYRRTYGSPIAARELVRRRLGRLAALITACDALTNWCAGLLDQGFRGEMECIIAKIFASEAQKEAAVELLMKTHGGRSFLHGHLFGDDVHEFLAPCIYEGEGEMLGLAFFKSLIKEHGKRFYEPIGKALQAAGLKSFNPWNPAHVFKLRGVLAPYLHWRMRQKLPGGGARRFDALGPPLAGHAAFAARGLAAARVQLDRLMSKHQLRLVDRQCAMAQASARVQDLVVMLVTCLHAGGQTGGLARAAADVLCHELRCKVTGRHLDNRYFQAVTQLGAAIAGGQFEELAGIEAPGILRGYDQAAPETP